MGHQHILSQLLKRAFSTGYITRFIRHRQGWLINGHYHSHVLVERECEWIDYECSQIVRFQFLSSPCMKGFHIYRVPLPSILNNED